MTLFNNFPSQEHQQALQRIYARHSHQANQARALDLKKRIPLRDEMPSRGITKGEIIALVILGHAAFVIGYALTK
jgi:hypothetical protein